MKYSHRNDSYKQWVEQYGLRAHLSERETLYKRDKIRIYNSNRILSAILILFFSMFTAQGQGNVSIFDVNSSQLDTIRHFTSKDLHPSFLTLSSRNGWIYKEGHDPSWAFDSIDYTGWRRVIPAEIDTSFADEDGRIEGWFRLRFSIDDTISQIPLFLVKAQHFASEVYLDGFLLKKYGETGIDRASFEEYTDDNPLYQLPVSLRTNKVHTLA